LEFIHRLSMVITMFRNLILLPYSGDRTATMVNAIRPLVSDLCRASHKNVWDSGIMAPKVVSLHAKKAFGGRGGIAPTHY